MKKYLFLCALFCASAPAGANAQTLSIEEATQKIKYLEEQIQILKKSLPVNIESAKNPDKQQLDVSVSATFLQPVLNDFNIYGANATKVSSLEDSVEWKTLDYGFNAGIDSSISYQFQNSQFGIALDYSSLNANASDSFKTKKGGGRSNTIEDEDFNDSVSRTVSGKSSINLYDWKLGSTYSTALNEVVDLDFGLGLQLSNINASIKSQESGSTSESSKVTSDFQGWGPYFGSGITVALFDGFTLNVGGKAGVLFGQSNAKIVDYELNENTNKIENIVWTDNADVRSVPTYGFDAVIDYTAKLSDSLNLIVNGGYQYNNYVGGVNSSFSNMADMGDSPSLGKSSNLILQGWKAGIGFSYLF